MRKLTVKNFSVIKEAELEFGKITVLIGPQSSGKSLLCKLAFFFECRVPEMLRECLAKGTPLQLAKDQIIENFVSYFPEEGRQGQEFHVKYEVGSYYSVYIEILVETQTPSLIWNNSIEEHYTNVLQSKPLKPRKLSSDERRALMSGGDPGPFPIKSDSVYIPTGRDFFSTPNRAFAALSTKNLDWLTNRFATEFDAEYQNLRESYQTHRILLSLFGHHSIEMLKGKVVKEDGRLLFESIEDGKKRPFEILSSGTLSLLPILNILAQVARDTGDPVHPNMPSPKIGLVFAEEPEISVFPETQYRFAKLIALLANSERVWKSYAITTHSPYILSGFNDLIEAGRLGADSAVSKEVKEIIPEKYWIKPGDFKAYSIHDGNLESIMDKETGLINGEYLDAISNKIGGDFDALLRIGYAKS